MRMRKTPQNIAGTMGAVIGALLLVLWLMEGWATLVVYAGAVLGIHAASALIANWPLMWWPADRLGRFGWHRKPGTPLVCSRCGKLYYAGLSEHSLSAAMTHANRFALRLGRFTVLKMPARFARCSDRRYHNRLKRELMARGLVVLHDHVHVAHLNRAMTALGVEIRTWPGGYHNVAGGAPYIVARQCGVPAEMWTGGRSRSNYYGVTNGNG